MIGIIARTDQYWAVHEFFELFKTPWEFYDSSRSYDVVIISDPEAEVPKAPLTLVFTRGFQDGDSKNFLPAGEMVILNAGGVTFPINTGCAFFPGAEKNLLSVMGKGVQAAIESFDDGRRVLNLGYDLFDEVEFLLSHGQTSEFAQIPTLDIHIALIRGWILQSGISVIEIPPVPHGFGFTACLTHDVDFLEIKDHRLDRSFMGFFLRALLPLSARGLTLQQGMSRMLKNWKAIFSLPAVFAGLARDFWLDVERYYMNFEKGVPATYFFIPFKNHPGEPSPVKPPSFRAAKYDIDRHKGLIANLIENGNEVGLHGIDAWIRSEKAATERRVITDIAGRDCNGIRMHWLYFSDKSPAALQAAGLKYDSSLGFNGAVGFRSGTTQVFRLPETKVFELPLTIMDTALFSRNKLSEVEAQNICERVLGKVVTYGGVATINWHTRSLSPERNWDDFYSSLLRSVRKYKPWFASGQQAVEWFARRRNLQFDRVEVNGRKMEISIGCVPEQDQFPPHILRVYAPGPISNGRSTLLREVPVRHGSNYEVEL